MRITVFGCGYVGLTTAIGLAEIGHNVIGIDVDEEKIRSLKKGVVPFYEPGMQKLLRKSIGKKRLQFGTNAQLGIQKSEVIFCAVAVPPHKKTITDLSAVLQVASDFALYAEDEKIFINKSTVPVGTSEKIAHTIKQKQKKKINFSVVSNPEFLREGLALKDFFQPDRIVIGLSEIPPPKLKHMVQKLFHPLTKNGVPILFTTLRNAEIIKYASNAFLATKISFTNELAQFCEKVGGDIQEVTKGMSYDPRIGKHFLEAGIGFGGSCLPKDLGVFLNSGKAAGVRLPLANAVKRINDLQPLLVIEKLREHLGPLKGKKIAVWGVAFKPNTDDLRDAPSLLIVNKLLKLKAKVSVYDPVALKAFQKLYGAKVEYGPNPYAILKDTEAVVLLTEWGEFFTPDFVLMKKLMEKGKVQDRTLSQHFPLLIDGRNVYDPSEVRTQGFYYEGFGRVEATK